MSARPSVEGVQGEGAAPALGPTLPSGSAESAEQGNRAVSKGPLTVQPKVVRSMTVDAFDMLKSGRYNRRHILTFNMSEAVAVRDEAHKLGLWARVAEHPEGGQIVTLTLDRSKKCM